MPLLSAYVTENAMPVEARAYPRPLPNAAWLGKLKEEILEPDLPIVDPHHHLWDHPGSRLRPRRKFGSFMSPGGGT